MAGGPVATGAGIGADAPKNKLAAIFIITFAAFGGILFGYDTGSIGGIKQMNDFLCTMGSVDSTGTCYITTAQESLIVSILSAGTFFGALAGAPVADIIGRRTGIMLATLVFSIGIALQCGSKTLDVYVVGRVFAGLGVGLVSILVPMYQSECSPKWIRGAVVSGYQFATTVGLLLASVINNSTKDRADHSSWRIPTSIQFVWAFILCFGMIWLPESPRFLVKKGNEIAAAKALGRLVSLSSDDPIVQQELDDIRTQLQEEQKHNESSYLDCFRPSHNKIALRTWSGILIQMWQQLTGINFIFYYGPTFFANSGINDPFMISIATNIVNVFMTIPGIYGIERFGRRSLLLWGAVLMAVCEYLIAIIGVTISVEDKSGQQGLIALVCIYIATFAATWGPIAWVITGEIFPLNVRAKAMSLSVASNWLWNWAIGYATPYLVNTGAGSAGLQSKVFFIWGSTCACCWVFTYFAIPETKGLSLEQIDLMYQNSTPLNSIKYRKEHMDGDMHVGNDHHVVRDDDKPSIEKV